MLNLAQVFGGILEDVRFSTRLLVRYRLSSLCVIVTVILAIGANNVVFSLVNALWLRPIPVTDAEGLAIVYARAAPAGGPVRLDDVFNVAQLRTVEQAIPALAVAAELSADDLDNEFRPSALLAPDHRVLRPAVVSSTYFKVLGVRITGPGFLALSEENRAEPGVVLSHSLWQSRFNGNSSAIGSEVTISGRRCIIAGVAPETFRGPFIGDETDLWLPFDAFAYFSELPAAAAAIAPLRLFIRTPDSASLQRAEQQIGAVLGKVVRLRTIRDVGHPRQSDEDKRNNIRLMAILGGTALLVFSLGCVNLVGLLLARADRRGREIAVRLALGISHVGLARLFFTEAFLFGVSAATGVLLVSHWSLRAIASFSLPDGMSLRRLEAGADWRVTVFAFVLSVGMLSLCSLVPTVSCYRQTRSVGGLGMADRLVNRHSRRNQFVLVLIHSAVSIILLIGALLLVKTVHRAMSKGLGFAADQVITVFVQPRLRQYANPAGELDVARRGVDSNRLIDRLGALPAVASVSIGPSPFIKDGSRPAPREIASDSRAISVRAGVYRVGADYFFTAGIPVLAGREFKPTDAVDTTARVAIVTRRFAQIVWGTKPALGRQLSIAQGPQMTVVGVVGDAVQAGVRGGTWPAVYLPTSVLPERLALGLLVRMKGLSRAAVSTVSTAVMAVFTDPVQLVVGTARDDIRAALAAQRFAAWLFSAFATVAVGLSALGLWGVVATGVAQRRPELAIRAAIGAIGSRLMWRTIAEALTPVVIGTVAGVFMAAMMSRFVEGYLIEVSRFDLASYAASVLLLLTVGTVSAWSAARGIRTIDPAVVLRQL